MPSAGISGPGKVGQSSYSETVPVPRLCGVLKCQVLKTAAVFAKLAWMKGVGSDL